MVSVRAVVTLTLIVGVLATARAAPDADAFVAHQVATQTFTADLQQTFHWTFPPKHVASTGRIYYQAPDRLALIFTNPGLESVIVRGNDLYIKRDQKHLVHHILQDRNGKPTQNVQFLRAFFQNGCTNYAQLFNATLIQTNAALTIRLVPKHMAQMLPLRSVTNVLGWPGGMVQSMRIGLLWDSYITYEFSQATRNQPLDEAVFAIPKE